MGYIKVYHKFLNNPFWTEKREFSRAEAWLYLLLNAQGIPRDEVLIGNKTLIVNRGELVKSTVTLSRDWRWTRGKVGRFLNGLHSTHMIELTNEQVTSRIRICNYEKYNPLQTGYRTANDTALDTGSDTANDTQISKENKEKEENKEKKTTMPVSPFQEIAKKLVDEYMSMECYSKTPANFRNQNTRATAIRSCVKLLTRSDVSEKQVRNNISNAVLEVPQRIADEKMVMPYKVTNIFGKDERWVEYPHPPEKHYDYMDDTDDQRRHTMEQAEDAQRAKAVSEAIPCPKGTIYKLDEIGKTDEKSDEDQKRNQRKVIDSFKKTKGIE